MLRDPINWLKIWMIYTFLTNSVQTPAGTLLYSTWLQMNFWEICVFHWVMDIWNCTFPSSTIEIENYNGCKSLNMALGSHNLTWFGCLRPSCATWWRQPSGRDDPQVCSCTLPACKRIFEKYLFCTENWTIEIALFLPFQWELKISNCYNWLNIALGPINWFKIWMFYTFLTTSVETSPRYILVLYLATKEFLRNMCFAMSGEHLKLHFSYLYNRNWNFQMTTTCLILLLKLDWHYPPTGTFLYSTWMQRNFWEICVFLWVLEIWNCTFLISTMGIEIFKWPNSFNIALGTWQRKPSDGDYPHQVLSCTLPDFEIIFEKYVFSPE